MGVLQELKTTLAMGARSNKYKVILTLPSAVGTAPAEAELNALCKGASIPAKSIGQIEVFSQGRKLVMAGDAEFENTWSLTFYNTQDHNLRSAFIAWMDFIDNFNDEIRGADSNANYMVEQAQVHQLNTTDNSTTASYMFYNLWPTNISAIDVADETNNEISETTVDFAFSHWTKEV